jgi:hypothetical protein
MNRTAIMKRIPVGRLEFGKNYIDFELRTILRRLIFQKIDSRSSEKRRLAYARCIVFFPAGRIPEKYDTPASSWDCS